MSFSISSHCIGCHACKLVCPKNAITIVGVTFAIGHRCDECAEQSFEPQCASICPVENAIVNNAGKALNPTNSLKPSTQITQKICTLQETAL